MRSNPSPPSSLNQSLAAVPFAIRFIYSTLIIVQIADWLLNGKIFKLFSLELVNSEKPF